MTLPVRPPRSVSPAWRLLLPLSFAALPHLPADTVTIAATSTPVPGGGTVSNFNPPGYAFAMHPTVTDAGDVIFVAAVADTAVASDQGIFAGTGGPLTTVARKAALTPDGQDTHAAFGQPAVGAMGDVLCYGTEADANLATLYRFAAGTADELVQSLEPTPGGASMMVGFNRLAQYPPTPNASGSFPFMATWGFGPFEGFFLVDGDVLRDVAKYGDDYDGGTWSGSGPHTSMTDDGVFAFAGSLNYPSLSLRNALFIGQLSGGTVTSQRLAREGDAAPDGNGLLQNFNVELPITPAGQFTVGSFLTGTSGGTSDNSALYRGSAAGLTLIARRGQTVPGVGQINASSFASPKINASGTVAFTTALAGTGGTTADTAVYVGSGGALLQLVREDQAAPDPAGVPAGRFATVPSDFAFNDAGQMAFATTTALRGVTLPTTSSVHGVFTTDGTDFINIARTGQSVEGSVLRTFATGRRSLNGHGQVAYSASLTDGRSVLRLWTPDLHWRSGTSGAWDVGGNWTLGLTPAAVHRVFVEPATAVTIAGAATGAAVKSLKIGGGGGAATLVWQAGTVLSAAEGVIISPNGTLAGGGTVDGTLFCEGTLSPGASAGVLTVAGVTQLAATAVTRIELGGNAPADSDLVALLGDATLGGTLAVSLIGGHIPAPGQSYLVTTVGGTRSGTFAGLPEGALVGTFAGAPLWITYAAGDGNDVALTTVPPAVAPLPPPTLTLDEPTGHVHLVFHGHPGMTYEIERTADLTTWTTVHTLVAPANGIMTLTDTSPPSGRTFYRGRTP